ncbi:glycosyltransferase [Epidermidibacterium keratini]|uniref:Glycosyltransferase n=1 Tax=Epidermidibacterium keratini TaxID=1891644 RepID=A0A7L4YUC7_9ACTN|nr:glycosyltransferase [Epidermidibacterium keratini]
MRTASSPRPRVLQVSWEFPPVVVGGLGRHVGALAAALRDGGADVRVLARAAEGQPSGEYDEAGMPVLRAAPGPPYFGFATELLRWVQVFNHSLRRTAAAHLREPVDLVHAHDWLVAPAAVAISREYGVPLVTTIHATEAGRHLGWLPKPLNRTIHQTEGWLVRASTQVITCSRQMRGEVLRLHGADPSRVRIIPNGIDLSEWRQPDIAATPAGPPTLVYAGRLVHEKGVQDLVAALPAIRRAVPGTRLVIAGTGKTEAALREQVRTLRLTRAVDFLGHLDPGPLREVMTAADLAVVPSRYEPFGIVALEFTALGVPLVVTDVGGLGEYAARTGGPTVPPGEPAALARAVIAELRDPSAASGHVDRARDALASDFSWPVIARDTVATYDEALRVQPAAPAHLIDRHVEPAGGNLLYGASRTS